MAKRKQTVAAPDDTQDARQLVAFLGAGDLDALTPGQRLDWHLWAAGFAAGSGVLTSSHETHEEFPDLRRVQGELSLIVRSLERGEPIPVTVPATRWLHPSPHGLRQTYEGRAREMFLARALDVLVTIWPALRRCPQCHRPFIGQGKRRFCSAPCTAKAQWEKFKARHPRRRRSYVVEYRRRLERRTGQRRIKQQPKEKAR